MFKLGLIGHPLTHSFSKKYFDSKFSKEKVSNFSYELFDLKSIENFDHIINKHKLSGVNITSPYKKKIIDQLDDLDQISQITKSVNTIFIDKKSNNKFGFNTDYAGFNKLLLSCNLKKHKHALILGSGGVSNTIKYALENKNISNYIISRNPEINQFSYNDLENILTKHTLIINTTPIGQHPNINNSPNLPYHLISKNHFCIDLIYNPRNTLFLEQIRARGAKGISGYKMLIKQAEDSWDIWNNFNKYK